MTTPLSSTLDGESTITTIADLNNVIEQADNPNATSGTTFEIDLGTNAPIALTSALDAINLAAGVTLDIEGDPTGAAGVFATLNGGGDQRGLFVYSGVVNISDLTIADAKAAGGAGGAGSGGGGGGAGLGGGLFVAGATNASGTAATSHDSDQAVTPIVTLTDVSFAQDEAVGGAGGTLASGGAGGGGGMGGAGGTGYFVVGRFGSFNSVVGGGGGLGGAGGGSGGVSGHTGIVPYASGGAGGFDDARGNIVGSGGPSGGGGGVGVGVTGGGGGGGGGGIGGREAAPGPNVGSAGLGGFGGGGGATPGLPDSQGGAGGFGGGGGGGGIGASGGFGGGGGGFSLEFLNVALGITSGFYNFPGGFGGGSSSTYGGGGGGLGAGGDIFVQQGGTLILAGGTLGAGTVAGGSGTNNSAASEGSAFGSGIFIQGNQSLTLSPGNGQTETITGVIADMSGSGGNGSGSLIMDGAGTLVLSADNTPGSSSDAGHAGFTGGITIENGTVDLAAVGAAGSGAITFDNSQVDPTLEFTPATAPTNEIDTFGAGDNIQIDDFLETPAPTYANGLLTLTGTDENGNAIPSFTLDIPGQALADFQVNVGATDTVIDYVACYCPGTLIRTPCGNKRVEKLQIGDEVMTASGAARPIKWIGRRSYNGRFVMGRKDILPVCIKAGALADNVPRRDLWISPNHAMFFEDNLGGVLIEANDLVNGVSIVQAERVDEVEYFHIELDTHDVLIAEGALSERFIDDDSRGMFHNAHEYRTLYPAVATITRYCAPRLDEGYEVEAIRQGLAVRAGLESSNEAARAGTLRGHVDWVTPHIIEGWAQNGDHPEAPVCLDIFAGGRLIGQVLANRHREDLQHAGIGSGHHSFAFTPPAGLVFTPDAIEVHRSLDDEVLPPSAEPKRVRTSIAA